MPKQIDNDKKTDCEICMKNISAYIDYMKSPAENSITAGEAEAVSGHLKDCSECYKYYESLKSLVAELGELPSIDVPDGFHEEMMAAIRKPAKIPFYMNFKAYASAAAVFILVAMCAAVAPRILAPPANDSAVPMSSMSDIDDGNYGSEILYTNREKDSIMLDSAFPEADMSRDMSTNNQVDAALVAGAAPMAVAATQTESGIKSVSYRIEVSGVDDFVEGLSSAGGRISGRNETQSTYRKDSDITYDVTGTSLDALAEYIENYPGAVITSVSENEYIARQEMSDLSVQIAAKADEVSRLTKLIEQSETIQDMLILEQKINGLNNQIDECERRLRTYSYEASSPLVKLSVFEILEQPAEVRIGDNFGESIHSAFNLSLVFVMHLLRFITQTVAALALPAVLIAIPAFFILRRRKIQKQNRGRGE